MAQRETMKRQQIIINYLRKRPRTFEEIEFHLENESEIHSYNFNISKRTFQRDKQDILTLYGIEIKCNRTTNKYEIFEEENNVKTERIMEAFDVFNTLNFTEKISEYIHFEDRKASGTHYIMDILTAIKNKSIITIEHKKYWEDKSTLRDVEPYAIKEYKYRWYLIAKDLKNNKIKSFGLDRIQSIIAKEEKFIYPNDFVLKNYFEFSYGVIGTNNKQAQKIVLSFTPWQGKYIKSLPIHHSQRTLLDNKDEYRIGLQLVVTLDFIMDLLSFGEQIRVLKPISLIKQIENSHKNAVNSYSCEITNSSGNSC